MANLSIIMCLEVNAQFWKNNILMNLELLSPPPPLPTPQSPTTVECIFSLKPLPQPLWKFQFHFWDPALHYYNGFKSLKWPYTYELLYSFCLRS